MPTLRRGILQGCARVPGVLHLVVLRIGLGTGRSTCHLRRSVFRSYGGVVKGTAIGEVVGRAAVSQFGYEPNGTDCKLQRFSLTDPTVPVRASKNHLRRNVHCSPVAHVATTPRSKLWSAGMAVAKHEPLHGATVSMSAGARQPCLRLKRAASLHQLTDTAKQLHRA